MNSSLLAPLFLVTGLALGILFMPLLPELGSVVIFLVCGVALFLWASRVSR